MPDLSDILKGAKAVGPLSAMLQARQSQPDPLDRVLKANTTARATIAAAGEDDPTTKRGPSALERILGPLDALGAGVRSLAYNAVSDKDVNPLEEMLKAAKGEDRIEGADILDELGVDNKWGKMLGGIAVDILLDPVTYLTFGYGAAAKSGGKATLTTLAKHSGDDLLKVAAGQADDITAEIAQQLGKNPEDVVSLIAKLKGAGHIDDTGRFTALVKGPEGVKEARALLSDLYSEFGRGGVKFAGVPLGGERALTSAGFKGKQALRAVPGSRWVEQTFGMGNLPGEAVDTMRLGNEALNTFIKTLRNEAVGGRRLARHLGQQFMKQVADDIPDDVARKWATVAVSEQFGLDRYKLAGLYDNVRVAMDKGDDEFVDMALKEITGFRKGVLQRAADNIDSVLGDAGLDAATKQDVVQGIARIEMRFDELLKAQQGAGLLRFGEFGEDATGFLPGVKGEVDDATAGILAQYGIDPTQIKDVNRPAESFRRLGLSAGETRRKKALTPLDAALGVSRDADAMAPFAREFDIAKIAQAGVEKGETRLAMKQFTDDLARGLGGTDEANATAMAVAKRLDDTFTSDEAAKGLLKAYDATLNFWKKGATIYRFPAFPARNTISNQVMLAQEGLWEPKSVARAMELLGKWKRGNLSKPERELIEEMVSARVITSYSEFAEQVGKSVKLPGEKFMGSVNELTENWSRMAGYLAAKNKGLSPQAAGEMVQKALLDYSDEALSVVEKDIIRRLVPFAKWIKGNLSKQTRLLFTRPGSVSWLGHVKQSGEAVTDYDRDAMPEWMRDLYAIPLPLTDDGDPVFISTAGVLPQGDLEILSGLIQGRLDPKDMFGAMSPIIRTPIEFIFNKDLWYDSEIARYPGEKKRAPAYVETFTDAVENVPGLGTAWGIVLNRLGVEERGEGEDAALYMNAKAVKLIRDLAPWMNNIGKVLDEQRRTPYDRVGALTGVKPVLFEQERFAQNQAYDDRDELQQVLARLKDEGRVENQRKTVSLADLLGGQ